MKKSTSSELMGRVELAIAVIRPHLLANGGDVRIVNVKGSVLEIELLCAGKDRPISAATMKVSVEEVVRRRVPEITEIVIVNVPEEEAV